MNSPSLFQPDPSSDNFRPNRRRWVPKGVVLLMVLFVVGLLSACQEPVRDNTVAEIAVPDVALIQAINASSRVAVNRFHFVLHPDYAVTPGDSQPMSNLNVF